VKELMAGMKRGAVNAIDVCKERAPAVAEFLSEDDVVGGLRSVVWAEHPAITVD
jgi:hypothetical protein